MESKNWIAWVLGILIMIAMSVSGYAINRIDSVHAALSEKYVQKVDFQCFAERIEKKLDRIIEQNGGRK